MYHTELILKEGDFMARDRRKKINNTEPLLPTRLREARKSKGLTQKELAKELEAYDTYITSVMVSAWEIGRKRCTEDNIEALSKLLEVSPEYLRGTDDEGISTLKETGEPILLCDLPAYDGYPVYVDFMDNRIADCWGVYDKQRQRIFCYSLSDPYDKKYAKQVSYLDILEGKVKIYETAPFYSMVAGTTEITPSKLAPDEFEKTPYVYVLLRSDVRAAQERYNGWYKHVKESRLIINSKGFCLPYEGLNNYYEAYLNPPY